MTLSYKVTLISMYHLKPLVSLGRLIKIKMQTVQIALCTDTVQFLCITTCHRKILWKVCVVEDTVTYVDKIVMFSHREKQIDILKFIQL